MTPLILPDAHAFGIVAIGAERRGAGGADPFVAAFMALLLFFEAFFQRLHELFPAAQRLDLLLLFLGEIFFGERAQPFFRDLREDRGIEIFESFEDVPEHPVEFVEIALVLHERRAREVIELVDLHLNHAVIQPIHQREIFLQGDGHLGRAKLIEELQEHGRLPQFLPGFAATAFFSDFSALRNAR